jgi:hypothetical protein
MKKRSQARASKQEARIRLKIDRSREVRNFRIGTASSISLQVTMAAS